MAKRIKNILFVNIPQIIQKGLSDVLKATGINANILSFNILQELENYYNKSGLDLIIINSDIPQNDIKQIRIIKQNGTVAKWIGLITNSHNRDFFKNIDDVIYLNDEISQILKILNIQLTTTSTHIKLNTLENKLSKRETEILKLLVKGKTNKEIADELFISIHTVNSHRKNIISKLGIKSTAAMAIYAVANNLIDINDSLDLIK